MFAGSFRIKSIPPKTDEMSPCPVNSRVAASGGLDSISETASSRGSDLEDEIIAPSRKVVLMKKTCKLCGSHLGLFLVALVYALIGGFVFQALESENEIKNCFSLYEKYIALENSTKSNIWELSKLYASQGLDDPDVREQLEVVLQQQLVEFRNASMRLQYNGTNCSMLGQPEGEEMGWSIGGSLLFAVTVMTTIGYGNIAPRTMYGRIIVMAYALIGIPITLMMLTDIGDVLTDTSKYLYSKVCCCGCLRRPPRRDEDGGDSPVTSPVLEEVGGHDTTRFRGKRSPVPSEVTDLDDDSDDDEEDLDYRNASIPLTISLSMLGFYLMFGACVFHLTEGWDVLAAAYYCFITISTVGFGDFVPGEDTGMRTVAQKWKMVFAGVYLLLGLAILSMCFQLIHEEIVVKFRMLAERAARMKRAREEKEDGEAASRASSGIGRRSASVAPTIDTPKLTKKD